MATCDWSFAKRILHHWEADQEDFFVVDGEALLIVEGAERPLRKLIGVSVAA